MVKFSEEEIEKLRKYVTNPDGDVFCIINLPGLAGPIMARYSRAPGGIREVMLKEFIKEGIVDAKKVQGLIERILISFGDDSVGELEGAHVSLEGISNLATKHVEDHRIGGSPIEQSTRYVVYDQVDETGSFRFFRDPKIMASGHRDAYLEGMNLFFSTYASLVGPMKEFFTRLKPIESAEYAIRPNEKTRKLKLSELTDDRELKDFKRTYDFDIKTKACDTIRFLLPAATLTNAGIFGNGRFFQYLLTKLYSSDLAEMPDLAKKLHTELDKIIPVFIKRAKRDDFLVETDANMRSLASRVLDGIAHEREDRDVILLDNDPAKFVDHLVAQMLFKYSRHPLPQLRRIVESLPSEIKKEIIRTYIGNRKSRRDRSGRALEFGYPFTFNLVGDFGIYRDLHRQRMLTQERQRLTTNLGFSIPEDIVEAGFRDLSERCRDASHELYERTRRDFPEEAQYAVLFGFNIRFAMGMNLREAQHMLELRTIPQGHPNYRRMCQLMNNEIVGRFPVLKDATGFVDHNNYTWARADSEASQRRRESKLEDRLGDNS